MARGTDWQAQLDALRQEIAALRRPPGPEAASSTGPGELSYFETLQRLVQSLLDDAEDAVNEHPVAIVAAALALGMVIGRVTAR